MPGPPRSGTFPTGHKSFELPGLTRRAFRNDAEGLGQKQFSGPWHVKGEHGIPCPRCMVTGGVDAGMTAGRPMPTQDDVLGYFNTLSNWGRWGDDDELGTLNHITDDVRLAAARAVRHGRSVSCAWEVAVPEDMERSTTTCPCAADMPGAEDMPVPGFHADRRWGCSSERLGGTLPGNTLTHAGPPGPPLLGGPTYNGGGRPVGRPPPGRAGGGGPAGGAGGTH